MAEFEDEHGQLGELPYPISAERGELYVDNEPNSQGGEYTPLAPPAGHIPSDIGASNNAMLSERTFSPGNRQGSVVSTFDTRPTNARDFYITGRDGVNPQAGFFVGKPLAVLTHVIPSGYVGVLRGFRYQLSRMYIMPTPLIGIPVSATILIDGSPVPGYTNLDFGLYTTDIIPLHVLAGENTEITLQLRCSPQLLDAVMEVNQAAMDNFFEMGLYGQHLKSRGLSVEFENTSQESVIGAGNQ